MISKVYYYNYIVVFENGSSLPLTGNNIHELRAKLKLIGCDKVIKEVYIEYATIDNGNGSYTYELYDMEKVYG
jgi:hypothetical protein